MTELLQKIEALEHEAETFGFAWEAPHQILSQIKSECSEIEALLGNDQNQKRLQEEIGDLLHAAFSLCVFCKFSTKETLKKTLLKFEKRLKAVKLITEERGLKDLKNQPFDELMNIWDEAKKRLKETLEE